MCLCANMSETREQTVLFKAQPGSSHLHSLLSLLGALCCGQGVPNKAENIMGPMMSVDEGAARHRFAIFMQISHGKPDAEALQPGSVSAH